MDIASVAGISALAPSAAEGKRPDDPAKVREAAQQFEALLIGQLLREARTGGGGWLGSGDGDCATEFGEQQLAEAMAKGGGLGLADLIASGLKTAK